MRRAVVLALLVPACRPAAEGGPAQPSERRSAPRTSVGPAPTCSSWATMVESSAWVSSLDIAIGRDGSTLLGGTFLGKLTFANTPDLTHASPEPVVSGNSFTVESGGSDGFVAKLDHEGARSGAEAWEA